MKNDTQKYTLEKLKKKYCKENFVQYNLFGDELSEKMVYTQDYKREEKNGIIIINYYIREDDKKNIFNKTVKTEIFKEHFFNSDTLIEINKEEAIEIYI